MAQNPEPPDELLYPQLLGSRWNDLDTYLQYFHGANSPLRGSGLFEIEHGKSRLARFLAWLLRFPKQGRGVPTQIVIHRPITKGGPAEIWERTFGTRKVRSVQSICRSKTQAKLLAERFGIMGLPMKSLPMMELRFRLEVAEHGLLFEPAGAAIVVGLLRLGLPARLSPQVHATVSSLVNSTCFNVSVKLVVPWAGLVLAYGGHLEPGKAKP